jgi:hypothetical protein
MMFLIFFSCDIVSSIFFSNNSTSLCFGFLQMQPHDASTFVFSQYAVFLCVCVLCFFMSCPLSDNVSNIISIDLIYIFCWFSSRSFDICIVFFFLKLTKENLFSKHGYIKLNFYLFTNILVTKYR